jgi:antitoxin PrlF
VASQVAKITSKGQITLPAELRERFGVGPGDSVEFIELRSGDVAVLPLAKSPTEIFGRGSGLGRGIDDATRQDRVGKAVAARGTRSRSRGE